MLKELKETLDRLGLELRELGNEKYRVHDKKGTALIDEVMDPDFGILEMTVEGTEEEILEKLKKNSIEDEEIK